MTVMQKDSNKYSLSRKSPCFNDYLCLRDLVSELTAVKITCIQSLLFFADTRKLVCLLSA